MRKNRISDFGSLTKNQVFEDERLQLYCEMFFNCAMRGDCLSVLFAGDSLNFFSDFHQILNKSKYLFLQGLTNHIDVLRRVLFSWRRFT